MTVSFHINPVQKDQIDHWFSRSDEELKNANARWVKASSSPGFPCRVSLEDAQPGERVLLFPYRHLDVGTPYAGEGPIYVRENARQAALDQNQLPAFFAHRQLSLRGYSSKGFLQDARVCDGETVSHHIESLFANQQIATIHIHFAAPGCFCCSVERSLTP